MALPTPKLADEMEKASEEFFNQPEEQRRAQTLQGLDRIAENKGNVVVKPIGAPKEPPDKPVSTKPEVPGQPSTDPKHEDDLMVDGMTLKEPDGIKTDQGKKSWANYKEHMGKALTKRDNRIKELEEKLKTAPDAATVAKLGELQKERDDLLEKLGQASLERTPEFVNHYDNAIAALIEDAKSQVPKDRADELAEILQIPEGRMQREAIKAFTSNMDSWEVGQIGAVLRDLNKKNKERRDAIKNWRAQREAEAVVRTKQANDRDLVHSKTFDSILDNVKKDNPFFAEKDGDAEWNERAKNLTTVARDFFLNKGTPEQRATLALRGVWADVLNQALQEAHGEMQKLQKQLEGVRAKTPRVGGDAGETTAPTEVRTPDGKPESYAERVARLAKDGGWVK